MREITIVFLLLFATVCMQAQNYLIDFTASGSTTTLDSVYVENLTQGTSLTLPSNDTLLLYGTAGISLQSENNEALKIYPNPLLEKSNLEFFNESPKLIVVEIFDITSKLIAHCSQQIEQGISVFEISGFASGIYTAKVSCSTWQKAIPFISLSKENPMPEIKLLSTSLSESSFKLSTKSIMNVVQMPYTVGDQMLFIGFSGLLSEIVYDVPPSSKTIDFEYTSTSCGASFTDARDSNLYPTVLIGSQCWMAKNLAYLPNVVGSVAGSTTIPYHYVYGYHGSDVNAAKATTNYATYGALYNWPAAMAGYASSSANPSGVQGVCPTGWHLPSDAEWTQLTDYLGGEIVAGGKLKEAGTSHWNSPNLGATNETGFNALPGGGRSNGGQFNDGGALSGYWWSSTHYNNTDAYYRRMHYSNSNVYRGFDIKTGGVSVRCLKNYKSN
ncbi:MAG: FISUMP domain-containing protein [Bacteroidales bacterium]|nr:FISUMP domain-containing protein [Bacteroidales bacterium]